MRGTLAWAGMIAALTLAGSIACWATPETEDLIRMAKSGVDEEVLMAYIKASPDTFDLSADEIITLKDLGIPSKVISEALLHGHPADAEAAAAAKEEIRAATSDTASEETPDISTAAAVAPPTGDQNISFFYQSLYPYGTWLSIDGEWCWQPNATVVSPDWAPYCRHGHWTWSDWGWCWVSDYSWGWAPFHYGRWFHHAKRGWCWVPDAQWGPAWVVWRTGDDYCGWAPLPPRTRFERDGFYFNNARAKEGFEFNLTGRDYFFLPKSNFSDPHPWVHIVPSIRSDEVYRRTVFEKDAYRFDHDHVFNQGPSIDDIGRASHREIKPVTIMHDNIRPGELIHRGMIKDDRLMIYRPTIAPQTPRNPPAIKIELEKKPFGGLALRVDIKSKNRTNREKSVSQQTLKIERANADAADRQRKVFEKQARNEPDPGKMAEIKVEADIQTMKAQQAQEHVTRIRQWNPPSEKKPEIIPQSRVVPAPPPEKADQVRTQLRMQVQNEARREDLQRSIAEEMIRRPALQPQPRSQPQPKENRGGGRPLENEQRKGR